MLGSDFLSLHHSHCRSFWILQNFLLRPYSIQGSTCDPRRLPLSHFSTRSEALHPPNLCGSLSQSLFFTDNFYTCKPPLEGRQGAFAHKRLLRSSAGSFPVDLFSRSFLFSHRPFSVSRATRTSDPSAPFREFRRPHLNFPFRLKPLPYIFFNPFVVARMS